VAGSLVSWSKSPNTKKLKIEKKLRIY
jgi:hypothetical protein